MLYDYKCVHVCGTVFEKFAGVDDKSQLCPNCGTMAERVISAPMIKLEGHSGDFPRAAMKWEKLHKSKGQVRKRT